MAEVSVCHMPQQTSASCWRACYMLVLQPLCVSCWATLPLHCPTQYLLYPHVPCRWHAGGRQLQKVNSVTDFLACLQHLFDKSVTSPGLVAAHAASAGALVLAAAVNVKPEYFSSVVLEAPFVDWTGAMGDAADDRLLAQHEVDEWGDPVQNPAVAEMIRSMCPYYNLTAGKPYPAMMVTAGLMDTRVSFWMPVKYVAKRRAINTAWNMDDKQQGRLVVLRFDEAAGHFSMGHAGGDLDDIAEQYAFMLQCQD